MSAKPVASYPYRDAAGVLLATKHRYEPKDFRWTVPLAGGREGFRLADANLTQRDLPIYRLGDVLSAPADEFVFWVEGEKDADNLAKLGAVASCASEGANAAVERWPVGKLAALKNRHVVILPDNDEPGQTHASNIAQALGAEGRVDTMSVRIVNLPNLPPKGDVSDWISEGGTLPQLLELVNNTMPVSWSEPETPREVQERLASQVGRLVTVNLARVKPESVEWLWPGRLPFGKLWLLDGPPGQGKSFLTMAVAAHVTTGGAQRLPDASPCMPADVVMIALEDGVADTLAPRARAAGVDLDRLHVVRHIERPNGDTAIPMLPDDVPLIRATVEAVGAKLVIIDPLMSYLGGDTDAHRDQDMRRALLPLAQMAEETGACVLVVRHTKKGAGKAINAGAGSLGGILGIARGAMVMNADPDDPNLRVLAVSKSNLAAFPDSLSLCVKSDEKGPRIHWLGVSPHTADSLTEESGGEERSAVSEAADWLKDELEAGPQEKKELLARAKTEGIAPRTLERAKAKLKVKHYREGFGRGYMWCLPDRMPPLARQARQPANISDVGEQAGDMEDCALFANPTAVARQDPEAWRAGEVGELADPFAPDPEGLRPVPF